MTAAEAARVAVSKSKGVTIEWKDGHRSEYALPYLRENCPCATCAGTHGGPTYKEQQQAAANPLQMFKPALRIEKVEPVGGYAMRLYWSDGHSSGIYSYEYLREICSCAECESRRAEA